MRLREDEEAIARMVVDALLKLAHEGVVKLKLVDTERNTAIIVYRGCGFTIWLYTPHYPRTPEEWVWTLERWLEVHCR
jgi:hypothetical protein